MINRHLKTSDVMLPPLALTVQQVAQVLAVSPRTVWRLVARSELAPPKAIGTSARWRLADVESFLDGLPYSKQPIRAKPKK